MGKQRDMTIWEHIGELRNRLLIVLLVFVIGLAVGLYYAGPVVMYLQQTPMANLSMNTLVSLKPSDALQVYMQFAFLVSMIMTTPVFLLQLWAFVKPGLKPHETKLTLSFIPVICLLFLVGLAFGFYVVFPLVVLFMTNINVELGTPVMWGLGEYFSFMFNMIVPFGFLFELPILVILLTRLRIINPVRLSKIRRYAYFILAFIAIVITPPDFMSDFIVMIPLFILYEISVFLSKIIYRRQLKEDEAWEREYGILEDQADSEIK
ncbi:twin-arginine translocase subunit TatC [Brevibacillus laterosporus]|uniref:twin-arginine translocase subunit TatC n=1 Tax=Brevibacillus laterosporus TaxID=1465 RepID=UPI0018CCA78D|nr:twin-arginine translocase subunit TatC [Brevibacillus laterosporus]MBG9786299.1 preprotein translocase subunit TatC [Brevibacillus laterosporus]MED1790067.1 twin-arginine translocase subunit TatC [Brevibacillus laterosporus]